MMQLDSMYWLKQNIGAQNVNLEKWCDNEEMYEGKLFDSVVFNNCAKEFLDLKKRLIDYFDESSIEDIFDHIQPQKNKPDFCT